VFPPSRTETPHLMASMQCPCTCLPFHILAFDALIPRNFSQCVEQLIKFSLMLGLPGWSSRASLVIILSVRWLNSLFNRGPSHRPSLLKALMWIPCSGSFTGSSIEVLPPTVGFKPGGCIPLCYTHRHRIFRPTVGCCITHRSPHPRIRRIIDSDRTRVQPWSHLTLL